MFVVPWGMDMTGTGHFRSSCHQGLFPILEVRAMQHHLLYTLRVTFGLPPPLEYSWKEALGAGEGEKFLGQQS